VLRRSQRVSLVMPARHLSIGARMLARACRLGGDLGMLKEPERPLPDASGNQEEVNLVEGTQGGRGTVTRNAFHLLLGQVTTTVLAILFSALLGRALGATEFGLYFLIASFSGFAYVIVDWGQNFHITREVACRPEHGGLFLGTALVLRTAAAAVVAVPSGLVAWTLGYNATTCWYVVVFIAASLPFFLAQSYGMIFRARDRMGFDAWLSVANKFAVLGFALPLLALGEGLPGVLVAQALAGFLALAIAIRLYRRLTTDPLRYSREIARQLVVSGGTLITFNLANNIQSYIDVVLLSRFASADVIGWYGAASNILGTLLAPALIIGTASVPQLSRAAASGVPFKAEIRAALRPILWLGALASIGTFLFADDAIAIVYGQHFGPSAVIMKVSALGFLQLFMSVSFFTTLFALGRAKALSVMRVTGVVITTALEPVLIPIFQERMGNGGIGVAAAAVASEFVIVVIAIFLLRREILDLDFWVDIARALGSVALTFFFFLWMPPIPFLVGVPLCVIVFSLSSLGLGLVQRDDIRLFKTFLRKE
jgi:O-antigen/teichoic acid export membrane protein